MTPESSDEQNTSATHIRVKGSTVPPDDNKKINFDAKLNKLESFETSTKSDKEKNISSIAKKMLIKKNAVGNDNIMVDERFYLAVEFAATSKSQPMFFSKYALVGEVLERIANDWTQLSFGTPYRPDDFSLCFQTPATTWNQYNRNLALCDVIDDCAHVNIIVVPSGELMINQQLFGTTTSPDLVTTDVTVASGVVDQAQSLEEYKKGDLVIYRNNESEVEAVVVGVHRDDVPSYYTIRIAGTDREKQTDGNRLRLNNNIPLSSASDPTRGPGVSAEKSATVPGNLSVRVSHSGRFLFLANLCPNSSVLDLKKRIESELGVAAGKQKLVCKGSVLVDKQRLKQTKVSDGCLVTVVASAGGARASGR